MTFIEHVTVHLHSTALHNEELPELLELLGFVEVAPDKDIEGEWDVRWFATTGEALLHLVASDEWLVQPVTGLSHVCVQGLGRGRYEVARRSKWVEHAREGSGRFWLNFHGLRFEVRP
jgi:hypothetical protein